jgi:ABC-2 type transport system permease protein
MNYSFLIPLRIAAQCMKRDFYVQTRRLSTWLVNYGIIKPILYSVYVAYVQSRVFFGAQGDPMRGTSMFAGEMLFVIFPLTYQLMISLLYDLEAERYIDYQMTFLSAPFILTQRIIFSSLFTFMMTIPFYPFAKLLLGSNIATDNTRWLALFGFLYICSLAISAYHMLAACTLKTSQQTRTLWARVNLPLIFLGGLSVPLYIMRNHSPLLGKISYLNPVIYMSEGLRQAILGGPQYLPLWLCTTALLAYTLIFTALSWYIFKRRVDHI